MKKGPEQHFLKDTSDYIKLLSSIDLQRRKVLELGVGTGVLTRLILDRNPQSIVGYEIEEGLCEVEDERLKLRYEDFTKTDLSFLQEGGYCLIANPPYHLLPFIRGMMDSRQLIDSILMVNQKNLPLFEDFELQFSLGPDAFEPPTKKTDHFVIKRGFNNVK